MTTLDDWTAAACAELGLDPGQVDIRQILDLAKVAAHQVDRPAAPVTAYLVGLAAGRGLQADAAISRLTALADDWKPREAPAQ